MLLLSGEPQKEESRQRLAALLAAKVDSEPARMRAVYYHLHRLGRETRKDGFFVTSFATHGVIDRGNGVLALADALEIKLEQTGLVLEDVLGDLHRFVSAGRRLVLVDACREYYEAKRGGGSPASTLSDAFVAAMEKARGCAVLAGAAHGGYAYDDHERQNGVFTGALLDGLRGEAEGNDKALITLESLADFAHTRVRCWIEKHRNPPEDAVLGILATYDPAEMRGLPLAINARKQIEAFAQRHKQALAHLVALVGTRDTLFKDVERTLDIDFPAAEHFELLVEVEAFDGTPRLRRALVGFLAENEEAFAPKKAPSLHTGRSEAEKPPWADAVGQDQYGLWADLRIEKVVQRLRFIEPGKFWMGSPEIEAERYPWEGPRHRVRLTQGFWLGATPCTQEVWQQVMGQNPSRFKSPRRPVENVSWEDVQEFLRKLRARVPGTEPRLPTEAEWEYACRAGTETSTYAGELKILGECNAPLLDGIAWYAGNSGVGYDLAEGADSKDWKDKQYPHQKAGSRLVGEKAPNPWGFYDMLGNVWEWCEDAAERRALYDSADAVEDPVGTVGLRRVFRGGSWYGHANLVRAASRGEDGPGIRSSYLGFRFSIGQLR